MKESVKKYEVMIETRMRELYGKSDAIEISPFTENLVTLTCEVCGTQYTESTDPKIVTIWNTIAINYYCCSLKCERESWSDDFVPIQDR